MMNIYTRVTCSLAFLAMASLPSWAADKPNIILILADDLGWMDTSFTGSKLYETPNIERLAKRGMFFPNAYAASPLCSPTRSSILTGMSPARTGFTAPHGHLPSIILKPKSVNQAAPTRRAADTVSVSRLDTRYFTLGKALKEAGYATGHFGKWHLGPEPYSPLEHGFDVDIPHWPGPGPAGSFVAPWKYKQLKPRTPKEHIEDRMGDEAVSFITKHKDKPFFLNYWQFSVHAPFDAKEEYIKGYRPKISQEDNQRSATYAAMVKSLDDNVGKIMDALEKLGIAEHTIVIFYSDNGGNMYSRIDDTSPTSNAPLRGGKATIYEGGIRVPAIVSWPGVVKPGSQNKGLIQSEDLYPTIMDMAGAEIPKGQPCDGINLLPALRNGESPRSEVYCYFPHSPPIADWSPPSVCVRVGEWKLIRFFHDAPDQQHRYELYNLTKDIGEQNNLAKEHPDKVRDMDQLIDRFLKRTKAVTPVPNSKYMPDAVSGAGGWNIGKGGRGMATLNPQMDSLQLRAFEDHAVLTTSKPLDLKPGKYRFRVKMESLTHRGNGWVSAGGEKTEIQTIHDRHMRNYQVELISPGGPQHLLFSPCPTSGTTQIKSMELLDANGKQVKQWSFEKKATKGKP